MIGYGKIKIFSGWWMCLTPECDIGKYYLYKINFLYRYYFKFNYPNWGSHITLIRGELPLKNVSEWNSYENKELEFEYDDEIKIGYKHAWLDVKCEELKNIRELFGLKREPQFDLHLTFAYLERIYPPIWEVI